MTTTFEVKRLTDLHRCENASHAGIWDERPGAVVEVTFTVGIVITPSMALCRGCLEALREWN